MVTFLCSTYVPLAVDRKANIHKSRKTTVASEFHANAVHNCAFAYDIEGPAPSAELCVSITKFVIAEQLEWSDNRQHRAQADHGEHSRLQPFVGMTTVVEQPD